MKAIQLTGFNGVESINESEVDRPKLGAGYALVEVHAAGLNYADIQTSKGEYPAVATPPYVLGFEVSGMVVEVGAGVDDLAVGDRIVSLTSGGGLAEYALINPAYATRIPEDVPFAAATTLATQGLTAYLLATHVARLASADRVLIQAAAGGVGLFIVQLAKIIGVQQVVALASTPEKRAMVTRLGADNALDYTDPDWTLKAAEATGGAGFDVIFNSVSGRTMSDSFGLLAPLGRFIVYGAANIHDTLTAEQMRELILGGRAVAGFSLACATHDQISAGFSALLRLVSEKRLELFADTVFTLSDIHRAFAALASRTTIGKVVLTP